MAALGTGGEDLVVLYEEPGAAPVRGHTGLFHLALVLPQRTDLARRLLHAADDRVPVSGLSDHFVSEAIYLSDPDGHGIEIYADRPRTEWERGPDGQLAMGTVALDVDALVATVADAQPEDFPGMPDGTTMGHVHLHVRDVDEADVTARTLHADGKRPPPQSERRAIQPCARATVRRVSAPR